jgi:cyanophycinase
VGFSLKGPVFGIGGSEHIAALRSINSEFVAASGGGDASLVLLLASVPRDDPGVGDLVGDWLDLGAAEVTPLDPEEPDWATKREIENATGIFIGGGDTREYHRLYVASELRDAIVEANRQGGVPVAGLSAGALLLSRKAIVWGARLGDQDLADPQSDGHSDPLLLGEGLGLVPEVTFDVHFTEWGRMPRLVYAVQEFGTIGIGLDDSSGVRVDHDGMVTVLRGKRVFVVYRTPEGVEKVALPVGHRFYLDEIAARVWPF